ncbi:hypothetical protein P691DRAFT_539278 [Macrolepiota fuliginosa MF-IS2]|uniref:NACHT domain-containing protein n=1 Tax=Macrolepiota fuliginosa MF-IS2 TaxID=1400762 RepID=A0A9P5XG12_9AGAR|nr:hypothetical protein P691DRAFT_539278 [Macrolepiota fuliginosa MF-IS2]
MDPLTIFIAILVGWVLHEFTTSLFRSSTQRLDDSRKRQAEVATTLPTPPTPPRNPDSGGTQGFFNNSHHFILNQPVIKCANESKQTVLPWLARFTMHGAEFDSSTRDPPPRCHPGTRIAILEVIHHWIDNAQPIHRLMWLNGPAGVGKSAIVQTLAEELSVASRLGATLFFSRPHGCNNPIMVFPTIAYQLAVRIPTYHEYLHQRMTDDPKILEKGMEHQFGILIFEPFINAVLPKDSGSWVIFLDGLDECGDEEAQSLIIKLISHFSVHNPNSPLIWLIASRPEAHLNLTFHSDRVVGSFSALNVPANSDVACRDVERFLRAKFKEIHYNYRDLVPVGTPWPAERAITSISESVQGYFVLASILVRFIEDPHICDPISQLAITLSIIEDPEADPLSFLYMFYTRILENVPKSMLPVLQLLLGWTLAAPILDVDEDVDEYPLVLNATVFNLQQHTVYAALRKLHSVINVPPLEESGRRDIRFYHSSFADYLCDASQSGEYAINFEAVDTRVFWSYFAMLKGKVGDPHCEFFKFFAR